MTDLTSKFSIGDKFDFLPVKFDFLISLIILVNFENNLYFYNQNN